MMCADKALPAVLIFEDDADLARQWAEIFKGHNIKAEIAPVLSVAMELCRQRQFDVIISDMFIKNIDGEYIPEGGISFINHLHNPDLAGLPVWCKDVPVIAVTGAPVINQFDVFNNIPPGCDVTLMRKPFEPVELLNKVHELLAARSVSD